METTVNELNIKTIGGIDMNEDQLNLYSLGLSFVKGISYTKEVNGYRISKTGNAIYKDGEVVYCKYGEAILLKAKFSNQDIGILNMAIGNLIDGKRIMPVADILFIDQDNESAHKSNMARLYSKVDYWINDLNRIYRNIDEKGNYILSKGQLIGALNMTVHRINKSIDLVLEYAENFGGKQFIGREFDLVKYNQFNKESKLNCKNA